MKPYMWICFAAPKLLRAWTANQELAEQLRARGFVMKPLYDVPDADAMRDTIARAVWRYQMCPGTFDQPVGEMGALAKNLCIDEAENIRRAIMGEPQLTDDPQADDDVVF
jgi:hypothetical protein